MSNLCRYIVLLFLLVAILMPGVSQEKIVEGGKTYLLHKIQKGEGFYRLSVIYGIPQKDIVDANPEMALQGLKEGSLVKIPQKSSSVVNQPVRQSASDGFKYHTVEKGETLYSISKKYNVAVEQLIKHNPGSDQSLAEGSVIRIPSDTPSPVAQRPNAGSVASTQDDNKKYQIHTIVEGETLYRIAVQYQVALADIIAANPFLDSNNIAPGSQIRIPKAGETAVAPSSDPAFLIHKVQPGESLFGIGTKYNRSVTELKLANENLSVGNIAEGQLVRIPTMPINLQLFRHSLFLTHEVKKKETVYGISKLYNVDLDVLKLVNPDVDFSSVKKGQELKIPTQAWYQEIFKPDPSLAVQAKPADKTVSATEAPCGTDRYTLHGDKINIALILPFDYSGYQLVKNTPDSLRTDFHRSLVNKSKPFVEFYEGVLLALDSLKQTGTSVNLFVYDSQKDTGRFDRLLQREEFERMNLIIGPAYSGNIREVAQFAKDKRIPVVLPFGQADGASIRNNPFVYQASPIDTLYQAAVVAKQLKDAAGKKIIVLTTGGSHPFETSVVRQIKQVSGGSPNIVFYRYVQREIAALGEMLNQVGDNIIIIPSIEEAKVSRILTNLGLLSDRVKKQISVWGYSDWLKFQTFEIEDLHKLNTTIYSSYGADYSTSATKSFSTRYRKWFQTEPISFNPYFQKVGASSGYSRYGMWGYDVTIYFVGAVRNYGQQFQKCIDNYNAGLLQTNFNFRRLTNWGGAYNDGLVKINFSRDFHTTIEKVK